MMRTGATMLRNSRYVPACTWIVSFDPAASIAAWMVGKSFVTWMVAPNADGLRNNPNAVTAQT